MSSLFPSTASQDAYAGPVTPSTITTPSKILQPRSTSQEIKPYTLTGPGSGIPNTFRGTDLVYGDNKFVVTGGHTGGGDFTVISTYYSYNGINWFPVTGIEPIYQGNTITYGNGVFVVSGDRSSGSVTTRTYYSNDGITWTAANGLPTSSYVGFSVVYGSDKFVLASNNNSQEVYYSYDGISWLQGNGILAINTNFIGYKVIYGNGKYIVIGSSTQIVGGAPVSRPLYYSTDGITWQQGTGFAPDWYSRAITYSNTKFSVTGNVGFSGGTRTYYSTDGATWTASSDIPLQYVYSITYANNKFILTGSSSGGNPQTYYSTDSITWVSVSSLPSSYTGNKIIYGNGKFIIIGQNNSNYIAIYYSNDGINWLSSSGYGNFSGIDIAFSSNKFVVTGSPIASASMYYSYDGVIWEGILI